jgi:hypothetical protein
MLCEDGKAIVCMYLHCSPMVLFGTPGKSAETRRLRTGHC